MQPEFGLLACSSENLGDEIQMLAARRFLPRVDRVVQREALPADPGGAGQTRVIFNGWFLHHPERWPPHEKIVPLLVSFHLSSHRPSRLSLRPTPARVLLSRRNAGWLRRHGPVGARDRHTLRLLQRAGVESYYSGCLTLTLPERDPAGVGGRVVASGLEPRLAAALASRTRRAPVVVDHLDASGDLSHRLARAEELLALYASARAVVTSRLHCALPCLALGTPVLYIPTPRDRARQAPALELAHHLSPRDFVAGRGGWDPEDPPPNPDRYRTLVPGLVRRCEAFVSA